MWLGLTTTHRQTWLFSSTSTYHSTNLLTARGVAHLVASTEQVARPATNRFHPSHWRPLEACCRPWTWWCNDATALAGYATMMMMTAGGGKCQLTTFLEWSVVVSGTSHGVVDEMTTTTTAAAATTTATASVEGRWSDRHRRRLTTSRTLSISASTTRQYITRQQAVGPVQYSRVGMVTGHLVVAAIAVLNNNFPRTVKTYHIRYGNRKLTALSLLQLRKHDNVAVGQFVSIS